MAKLAGQILRLRAEFVGIDGSPSTLDTVTLTINHGDEVVKTYTGDAIKTDLSGAYYVDYVLPDNYKELTYTFAGMLGETPVSQSDAISEAVTKDRLIRWVTGKLGNQYSADATFLIENAIYDALDDLSRLRPITGYRTLNLTPQVSTYLLDDDVIDVQDCWLGLSPNYSFGHDLEAQMFGITGRYEYVDINTFHSPSLILMLEQKWESLRDRYSTDWEYDPDTNSIRVIPEPSQVGKAVYKYAAKRTLADLPQKYMAGFKSLVFAECLEATDIERSRISSIPVGIGSVTFNTASSDKKIEQIRQDAYRKLGIGGGGFVIG